MYKYQSKIKLVRRMKARSTQAGLQEQKRERKRCGTFESGLLLYIDASTVRRDQTILYIFVNL